MKACYRAFPADLLTLPSRLPAETLDLSVQDWGSWPLPHPHKRTGHRLA
jgi:hypothetical protein